MIDKSIRQYYQEGKKVNVIQEGIKKFVPTTDQGKLDVGQIAKNVATNKHQSSNILLIFFFDFSKNKVILI